MIDAILAAMGNTSPTKSAALPPSPGGFPEALLLAAIFALVAGIFAALIFYIHGAPLKDEESYRYGRKPS